MINKIGTYLHGFVIIHYPFLMVTAIGKAMIMLTIVANLQIRQKQLAYIFGNRPTYWEKVHRVDKQRPNLSYAKAVP